jgi:hypothetical protein
MADLRIVQTHELSAGRLNEVFDFLKRTRDELRMLRKVHVFPERLLVIDVNGDAFEVRGIGYSHADAPAVLDVLNTVYNRQTLSQPTDAEYKEFKTGRRYAWAADRVM